MPCKEAERNSKCVQILIQMKQSGVNSSNRAIGYIAIFLGSENNKAYAEEVLSQPAVIRALVKVLLSIRYPIESTCTHSSCSVSNRNLPVL